MPYGFRPTLHEVNFLRTSQNCFMIDGLCCSVVMRASRINTGFTKYLTILSKNKPLNACNAILSTLNFSNMLKIYSRLNQRSKLLIMLWDTVVFVLLNAIVHYFRFGEVGAGVLSAPSLWFVIWLTLLGLYVFGCYDLDGNIKPIAILLRQGIAVSISLIWVVLANFLLRGEWAGLFGRGVLLGSLGSFFVMSTFYRLFLLRSFQKLRESADLLFVVNDRIHESLRIELKNSSFAGKITILDQSQWSKLESYLERPWNAIVVATTSQELNRELGPVLMSARLAGQSVRDLSLFYEETWRKVPIYYLEHDWFVLSEGFDLVHNPINLRIKRLGDLVFSTLMLSIAWPFMLLTAIAVKLESKGPAVYSQTRTGLNGEEFIIYKFRSMRIDAEKNGAQWASKNDSRVTRVGKFIRLTRLDELPQLWNVFKGDMSFIGPRPERPEFNKKLEELIPFYNLRHLVRPGITGWAQVLYPYGASVDDAKEKLQYDLFYIKNYSFVLDLSIVLKTISVVVLGRGR